MPSFFDKMDFKMSWGDLRKNYFILNRLGRIGRHFGKDGGGKKGPIYTRQQCPKLATIDIFCCYLTIAFILSIWFRILSARGPVGSTLR